MNSLNAQVTEVSDTIELWLLVYVPKGRNFWICSGGYSSKEYAEQSLQSFTEKPDHVRLVRVILPNLMK